MQISVLWLKKKKKKEKKSKLHLIMSVYSLNIYHFAPSQNWFSSIYHGPYILLPTFSLLLVNLLKVT